MTKKKIDASGCFLDWLILPHFTTTCTFFSPKTISHSVQRGKSRGLRDKLDEEDFFEVMQVGDVLGLAKGPRSGPSPSRQIPVLTGLTWICFVWNITNTFFYLPFYMDSPPPLYHGGSTIPPPLPPPLPVSLPSSHLH